MSKEYFEEKDTNLAEAKKVEGDGNEVSEFILYRRNGCTQAPTLTPSGVTGLIE